MKARGYVFKYKFIWLGWFLIHNESPNPLYSDNTPTMTIESETNISYLTVGLTMDGVMKKMRRYAKKHYS